MLAYRFRIYPARTQERLLSGTLKLTDTLRLEFKKSPF